MAATPTGSDKELRRSWMPAARKSFAGAGRRLALATLWLAGLIAWGCSATSLSRRPSRSLRSGPSSSSTAMASGPVRPPTGATARKSSRTPVSRARLTSPQSTWISQVLR